MPPDFLAARLPAIHLYEESEHFVTGIYFCITDLPGLHLAFRSRCTTTLPLGHLDLNNFRMHHDLTIDRNVRDWVFIPLTIVIVLMNMLRQYAHIVRPLEHQDASVH
jgi:hypothetical protein